MRKLKIQHSWFKKRISNKFNHTLAIIFFSKNKFWHPLKIAIVLNLYSTFFFVNSKIHCLHFSGGSSNDDAAHSFNFVIEQEPVRNTQQQQKQKNTRPILPLIQTLQHSGNPPPPPPTPPRFPPHFKQFLKIKNLRKYNNNSIRRL